MPPYPQIVILRPAGAAAHSPGQRPEDNEAMSHAQQGQKRHSICQMNQKKGEKAVVQNDTSLVHLLVREVFNRLQRYGKVFKLPKKYVIIFENQAKLMLESVEQFLKMLYKCWANRLTVFLILLIINLLCFSINLLPRDEEANHEKKEINETTNKDIFYYKKEWKVKMNSSANKKFGSKSQLLYTNSITACYSII